MRLVYKLFIISLLLLVTGVGFAGKHADLDRRLQLLKSNFVQFSQQTSAGANQDRILLGFTEKTSISLQSMSLSLNGQELLKHRYQEDENRSLREGGIQPLLDLKLPLGRHQLLVSYAGQTPDGKAFQQSSKISISKSSARKIIELTLSNKANSAPRLGKREH